MIIKDNPEEFLSYLEDTSNFKGKADILYLPEDAGEIQEITRNCYNKKIPLTCSAARTGTTGGCVPLEGGILSLERLNRIIDIDVKNKIARVESGLPLKDLENELNGLGFTLRAQPTESLAFVGAAASTCASGVRGFKYGSIRNYIKKLKIVFAEGLSLDIKRGETLSQKRKFLFKLNNKDFRFLLPTYNMPFVKSQAGYFIKDNMDLVDLFIGSEGTLGVIVELELSIQPLPKGIFDGVAFFNKEMRGLNFIDAVKELKMEGAINPTSLELFDANSLEFLRKDYSHTPICECAVYFEQEVENNNQDRLMDIWMNILESHGVSLDKVWFGDKESERERIYEFRHRLPELINEFLRKHNQTKLSADIAVPQEQFREMYAFYKKKAKETGVYYVNFGHVGENHLHFNFLPKTDGEHIKAKKAILEVIKRGVYLGGTISAEHGIGKIKKPYLEIMYGKKHIKEMASLKKYFDRNLILGIDNVFDKEIPFNIK